MYTFYMFFAHAILTINRETHTYALTLTHTKKHMQTRSYKLAVPTGLNFGCQPLSPPVKLSVRSYDLEAPSCRCLRCRCSATQHFCRPQARLPCPFSLIVWCPSIYAISMVCQALWGEWWLQGAKSKNQAFQSSFVWSSSRFSFLPSFLHSFSL